MGSGQGFFESDEGYRDRISQEASEHTIEKIGGSAPSQGWFESDESYRDRIHTEANEQTVRALKGESSKLGFFESDESYDIRIRKEANEYTLKTHGTSPKQGCFESDHDYRSRIAHEARKTKAYPDKDKNRSTYSSGYSSSSNSSGLELFLAIIFFTVIIGFFLIPALYFIIGYNGDPMDEIKYFFERNILSNFDRHQFSFTYLFILIYMALLALFTLSIEICIYIGIPILIIYGLYITALSIGKKM